MNIGLLQICVYSFRIFPYAISRYRGSKRSFWYDQKASVHNTDKNTQIKTDVIGNNLSEGETYHVHFKNISSGTLS